MSDTCENCGASATCVDEYLHDGNTIEIVSCKNCGARGALIRRMDGQTGRRGCLSEEDYRLWEFADWLRSLRSAMSERLGGDAR